MTRDAVISDCGLHRLSLTRRWDDGPAALWIMLNPSTADAATDDPTMRRVVSFTRRFARAAASVVNLWTYRSARPDDLIDAAEAGVRPLHPDAQAVAEREAASCDLIVLAWGAAASRLTRRLATRLDVDAVIEARPLGARIVDLGRTRDGQPLHPLYVPAAAGDRVLSDLLGLGEAAS